MALEGVAVNSLDASGRLTLRESIVNSLEGSVVITQGFDANLMMFSPEQWLSFKQPFGPKPIEPASKDDAEEEKILDTDMEDLFKLLISPAEEVELDDRGRIKIPEPLREWAQLKPGASRVMVLDVDTRWEIWGQEHYRAYMQSRREDLKNFVSGKGRRSRREAEDEER